MQLIRSDATYWEKLLIYIALGAGGLALFAGVSLLLFGLALGADTWFQTSNGILGWLAILLAAGYLSAGTVLARRRSAVAWGGLMLIFVTIGLAGLVTAQVQGMVSGLAGLFVGYRAASRTEYDLRSVIAAVSANRTKLLVAGLVVVIVIAAGVLAVSLAPALDGLLGSTDQSPPPPVSGDTATPVPPDGDDRPDTPTATFESATPTAGFGFTATFDRDRALRQWTVRTEPTDATVASEGDVTISDGRLVLRAYKCHRVVAERRLGDPNGSFRMAFDWESEAEEWYERPGWQLVVADGSRLNYTVVEGRDVSRPNKSSHRGGELVATAYAETTVTLRFFVRPSRYCHRGNHGNTFLRVDNVTSAPREE